MKLRLRQSDFFWADLTSRVDWYRDRASPEIAERFVETVHETLRTLTETPALGRLRFPEWPKLAGVRSWRVARPFQRHLIFYRIEADDLLVERLIHGARDLRRRLLHSPEDGSEDSD